MGATADCERVPLQATYGGKIDKAVLPRIKGKMRGVGEQPSSVEAADLAQLQREHVVRGHTVHREDVESSETPFVQTQQAIDHVQEDR